MPQVIDIQKEMDTRTFLEGRHVDTPPEELEAAFAKLAHYRDGGIFAGGFSGVSRWERHRNGDEIVHVLSGTTRLTIMRPCDELIKALAGSKRVVRSVGDCVAPRTVEAAIHEAAQAITQLTQA